MRKMFVFGALALALGLGACGTDAGQSYSLAQLENNADNQLHIREENPRPDLHRLAEALADLDLEGVKARFNRPGLGYFELAYTLHYLGNRHLEAGQLKEGVHYHRVAAEQYANPLSQLKLAQILLSPAAKIEAGFPGQVPDFKPADTLSAFRHFYAALDLTEALNTRYNEPYTGRLIGPFLRELLAAIFDEEGVRARLSAQTPHWEKDLEAYRQASLAKQAQFLGLEPNLPSR